MRALFDEMESFTNLMSPGAARCGDSSIDPVVCKLTRALRLCVLTAS